jgi:4-hydroxy-tetrahydrodipicolinate synthase
MTTLFHGTGTALSTPFNADGSIDFDSFGKLIDTQLQSGIEALAPGGPGGVRPPIKPHVTRAVNLSPVDRARAHDGPRPVVIAGTGSNITADSVQLTREAQSLGADAALLVSPYYNKPTQRGLLAHFGAIAEGNPEMPLVLYNVPARTSSNMLAETTLELAHRYANVVAIKEASADLDQCSRIIRDAPESFALYSGEDSITLPLLAIGARGVIAVVSNQVPKKFGDMVRAALAGDFQTARAIHLELFELMRLNFIESNPMPVKESLVMMGIFPSANFRLPLTPLADASREKLRAGIEKLGLA